MDFSSQMYSGYSADDETKIIRWRFSAPGAIKKLHQRPQNKSLASVIEKNPIKLTTLKV